MNLFKLGFLFSAMTISNVVFCFDDEEKLQYDPHKELQKAIDSQVFKKDDFLAQLNSMESSKSISAQQSKELREMLNKMSESDFNNMLKDKALSTLKANSATSANHAANPTDGLNPQLMISELLIKVQKESSKSK